MNAEIVLGLIALVSALLTGAFGIMKLRTDANTKERIAKADEGRLEAEANADAVKKEAESKLNESAARAKEIEAEAEKKIVEARSQSEMQTAVLKIIERQQVLMDAMNGTNQERDKEHLSRYGTVIGVTRDINVQLVNISNALSEMSKMQTSMQAVLIAIPTQIEAAGEATRQSIKDAVAQVRTVTPVPILLKPEGDAVG